MSKDEIEAFIKNNSKYFNNIVWPYLNMGASKEDLLQEAYLSFIECCAKFDPKHRSQATIHTFAYLYVKNAVLRYLQKSFRAFISVVDLDCEAQLADDAFESGVEYDEMRKLTNLVLNELNHNLSDKELSVIHQLYYQNHEHCYSEVARAMNCDRRTVKKSEQNAIKKLKFLFEDRIQCKVSDLLVA
jgi:RNA polymerase sigma factor (sigma-70 family)